MRPTPRRCSDYSTPTATVSSPGMTPARRRCAHLASSTRWPAVARHSRRDEAREAVVDAYFFLAENWEPEDRIFLLGAGRGAYCARALARMLGTVGMLMTRSDHVVEYALAAFALPSIGRTSADWNQIQRLVRALAHGRDVAVPVHFLGLWDTVKVPGTPAVCEDDSLGNVVSGRHAVAIDGGSGPFGECRVGRDTTPSRKSGSAARTAMSSAARTRTGRWPTSRSTGCSTVWSRRARSSTTTRLPRTPAPTDRDALAEGARRCASARCPRTHSCTPASRCTCARIPTTGAGCRGTSSGPISDWAARAERMPCARHTPAVKRQGGPVRTHSGGVVGPNALKHGLIHRSQRSRCDLREE